MVGRTEKEWLVGRRRNEYLIREEMDHLMEIKIVYGDVTVEK